MDTKAVQQRLTALGYAPGPADGKLGPKTKAAVKAFQVASGLSADGIVGPLTGAALFPQDDLPKRDKGPVVAAPSKKMGQWPTQRDCFKFYGGVGLNQTTLTLPFSMKLAWDKKTTIRRFSIHEKCHDSALRCFENIAEAYNETQRTALGIDLFGGCLNVRKMRGGSSYSMHSWGIAIDFDSIRNQLKWGKDKARLAKSDAETFWRIWEAEGWVSLGRARNYDWMHIQAARL